LTHNGGRSSRSGKSLAHKGGRSSKSGKNASGRNGRNTKNGKNASGRNGRNSQKYYAKHGKKFSKGYYYEGRHHNHWSQRVWSDDYGQWLYLDPDLGVYYYWYEADETYYPITYQVGSNSNLGSQEVVIDSTEVVIDN
jgi:hypothetical protein